MTFFTKVELHRVPREENPLADALATLAALIKVQWWNQVPSVEVGRLDR